MANTIKAFVWLINHTPKDVLLPFLKEQVEFGQTKLRGFKMDKTSLSKKPVVARVAKIFSDDAKLSRFFFSRYEVPWYAHTQVLKTFKTEWLLENFEALLINSQDLRFVPAMAADNRTEVSKKGFECLENEEWWKPDTFKQGPADGLPKFALLFPKSAQAIPTTTNNKKDATHLADVKRLQQELEKVRAKNRKFKAHSDELASELAVCKNAQKDEKRQLRKENSELTQAMSKLAAEFQDKLKTELEKYRREVMTIADPISEAKRQYADVKELLEATDSVLARHEKLNEAFAEFTQVKKEISLLTEALERIKECGAESLVTESGLLDVQQQLEEKLRQLKSLPRVSDECTAPTSRILGVIKSVPVDSKSKKKLQQYFEFFSNIDVAEIADVQSGVVNAAIHTRLEEIDRQLKERALASIEIEDNTDVRREVGQVASLLRTTPKLLYCLVDGCNVQLHRAMKSQLNKGFTESRQWLKARCVTQANSWEKLELIFDSKVGARNDSGNFSEIFVEPLTEDQNADNYIIRRMESLRKSGVDSSQICLVTADRGLRFQSRSLCEKWIDPQVFYQYLLG